MLVLSRKKDEYIDFTVTSSNGEQTRFEMVIVEHVADKTRLGFEAPRNVTIHRREVQEKVDAGEGKDGQKASADRS